MNSNQSDDPTDLEEINDSSFKNHDATTTFNIIYANARSLCPKIHSLIDCFNELDADVAIITETWLTSSPTLDKDIEDLFLGAGIGLLVRSRDPGSRGFSHGGVGLAFRSQSCTFREIHVHNPDNF